MYWLLPYEAQEEVRATIAGLTEELGETVWARDQTDQVFVFSGRKDRRVAKAIIRHLSRAGDLVCDPFGGSGVFALAATDLDRQVCWNEWEPYAFEMATQAFRGAPERARVEAALDAIDQSAGPDLDFLYRTVCPSCGANHVLNRFFYDRSPLEYFRPTAHRSASRMGPNGENVVFRGRYKCQCGSEYKFFDHSDLLHMDALDGMDDSQFPSAELIENSRINLTAPDWTSYPRLFPKRSRLALLRLFSAIEGQSDDDVRRFLHNAAVSILANAKYVDYHNKTQDLHCPEVCLVEVNVYHMFLEKVAKWLRYYESIAEVGLSEGIRAENEDFRVFLMRQEAASVGLLLTDPPYGDSEPYFEKAQRFHPFMGYSLIDDAERLRNEVVVSNAPSRQALKTRDAFVDDLRQLFRHASRVVRPMGYMAMYFRPQQSQWIADFNRLKLFARSNGFEPLYTVDLTMNDPSMRVLASTAWTFEKDVCFVFLRLPAGLERWFEGEHDIDELIYLAARAAAGDRGQSFLLDRVLEQLRRLLRAVGLSNLTADVHMPRIRSTLLRFASEDGGAYRLRSDSPYVTMNRTMSADLRAREFAPVVVEQLSAERGEFTFEQFVIGLSTYLDNGSRQVITALHDSHRLVPELLLTYAEPTEDGAGFRIRRSTSHRHDSGRQDLLSLSPSDFEHFIGSYFEARGFSNVTVIGQSRDRGVDVLATSPLGELHLIQCKRYQPTSGVGSTAIQRVDSYRRSRGADHAWVISTSYFTAEGRGEAAITGVSAIDGRQLLDSLEHYFPGRYYISGLD